MDEQLLNVDLHYLTVIFRYTNEIGEESKNLIELIKEKAEEGMYVSEILKVDLLEKELSDDDCMEALKLMNMYVNSFNTGSIYMYVNKQQFHKLADFFQEYQQTFGEFEVKLVINDRALTITG